MSIDDDVEDETLTHEEARFVTLIDVNDSLVKKVLLDEHRRLDDEVSFSHTNYFFPIVFQEKRLSSVSE